MDGDRWLSVGRSANDRYQLCELIIDDSKQPFAAPGATNNELTSRLWTLE